jgi:hypothetical protein
LFAAGVGNTAKLAWRHTFILDEAPPNSYLVVTVPGSYSPEQVFAGIKDGPLILPPNDRSPSFLYNNWEHVDTATGNASFYFAIGSSMLHKRLEVALYSTNKDLAYIKPELWITTYPLPFAQRRLVLE